MGGVQNLGLALVAMVVCGPTGSTADAPVGDAPQADAPVVDAPGRDARGADAAGADAPCVGPGLVAGGYTFACGFGTCPGGNFCFLNNEGPPCFDGPDAGQCDQSWCVLSGGGCVPDWHIFMAYPTGCATCDSLLAEWFPAPTCQAFGWKPTCTISGAGDVTLSCKGP